MISSSNPTRPVQARLSASAAYEPTSTGEPNHVHHEGPRRLRGRSCARTASRLRREHPEHFCAVYDEQRQQYLAKYDHEPEDAFGGMTQIIGAISEWVPMLKKLEAAAPPDLEPDLEHIREVFQEQQKFATQNGGTGMAVVVGSTLYGLTTEASWRHFASYVQTHCGSAAMEGLGDNRPTISTSTEPEPTPTEEPTTEASATQPAGVPELPRPGVRHRRTDPDLDTDQAEPVRPVRVGSDRHAQHR